MDTDTEKGDLNRIYLTVTRGLVRLLRETQALVTRIRTRRRAGRMIGAMAMRRVACSQCGTALPLTSATGGPREPCPSCGGTAITVSVEGGATVTAVAGASYVVQSSNAAASRRDHLTDALADVESAVDANNVREAQTAVKRALELIHELNDCERRHEWTQAGWTPAELELWTAHIGARNAAHHTSSGVVAIHSDPARDNRLRWDLDAAAISSLRFPDQGRQYNRHLAHQPLLPALHAVVRRVESSV
jgi:hypothetical protein